MQSSNHNGNRKNNMSLGMTNLAKHQLQQVSAINVNRYGTGSKTASGRIKWVGDKNRVRFLVEGGA